MWISNVLFPCARENQWRSEITQKKAVNNNRWAKQTRADIWTPFKIQKKQHSIIQKGLWEKTKALYSTPLRRQTQEQGEQQARKQPFISILNSFKLGEIVYNKSRERDFAIATHCSCAPFIEKFCTRKLLPKQNQLFWNAGQIWRSREKRNLSNKEWMRI